MPNFLPSDLNQTKLFVCNLADQLQRGTFEFAIHHIVTNRLRLDVFNENYTNDKGKGGRKAYDPAVLLKVILFAYSKGITSSREISWCCENNLIFRALSCDTTPHFTTISNFVSRYPHLMANLFNQVVLVCYEEKLLGNELFAIDGCKIPSNASREWSGTHKELSEKRAKIKKLIEQHIKAHRELDKREQSYDERATRHEQAVDTLDKAFDRIDRFLNENEPKMGQGAVPKEVKSNVTDNESAKMKTTTRGTIQGYCAVTAADKLNQIIVGTNVYGHAQERAIFTPFLEELRTTFNTLGIRKDIYKSRTIITADTGFYSKVNNAYLKDNGVNAVTPDPQFRQRDPVFDGQKTKYGKRHADEATKRARLIPASEFDFNEKKKSCVCPEGNTLSFRRTAQNEHGDKKFFFEGKLLQCRHCPRKQDCMENPESADHRKGNGRQVSFTVKGKKKKATASDWMQRRVDSAWGKSVYGHRMSVIEPVFANIGTQKGLDRFSLRGKEKVQGQWKLFCMVHNIEKIMRYGKSFNEAA